MVALLLFVVLLPSAARAAEVAGQVTDGAGAPVANVEVVVWSSPRAEPPALLRTDHQGLFTIPWRDRGALVCASGPRHGLTCAWLYRSATQIALRLPAAHTARGRLLTPDGSAASGVTVRLAALPVSRGWSWGSDLSVCFARGWQSPPDLLRERFTARTDATGVFRIPGLLPGGARFAVADPRYAADVFPADDSLREIHLRAGCRIRGRLCAGDAGLPGWSVRALAASGEGEAATAATGPDGGFLLTGLAPGEYTLRAAGPEDARLVAGLAEVKLDAPGAEAEVALRAVPGCVVAGRVVAAADKGPLAGVSILVEARPAGGPAYREEPVSGPDGRFRVLMPAGPCRVHPAKMPRGSFTTEVGVTVVAREGQENAVELPLQVGPAITGHVRDARGNPVPGTWVAGLNVDALACTGVDGSFRLPRVKVRDVISLTAQRGDEGTARPVELKPPFPADVTLTLGLLPQIALVGRVVDDRGRPVPHLQVCLMMRPNYRSDAPDAPSLTDAAGRYRFVIHDLTGRYYVESDSDERRLLAAGTSLGDNGPERRMSDVVVTAADASVFGRVLDAAGRPAAGAVVLWALGTFRHRAVADAQGRFRIDGLPRRPVTLVARGEEHGSAVARAVPGRETLIQLAE